MKQFMFFIIVCLLLSCGNKHEPINSQPIDSAASDTTGIIQANSDVAEGETEDTTDSDYETFFILIADTGADYFVLREKMLDLNRKLNIPIDTMGRYFNRTRNLIALPDDDEDELYAGEYYPRRFPSESLSLEYLHIYRESASEKTIAILTGIYDTESGADSAFRILQQSDKNAFKIKASIYTGCMH